MPDFNQLNYVARNTPVWVLTEMNIFIKNNNLLKFENLIKMDGNENKNWRQIKSVIIYILKILCFIIQRSDLYDQLFFSLFSQF